MKQMIMMIAAITVGTGAAVLFLSRSTAWKKHRRPITFREFYEDNRYSGSDWLFE